TTANSARSAKVPTTTSTSSATGKPPPPVEREKARSPPNGRAFSLIIARVGPARAADPAGAAICNHLARIHEGEPDSDEKLDEARAAADIRRAALRTAKQIDVAEDLDEFGFKCTGLGIFEDLCGPGRIGIGNLDPHAAESEREVPAHTDDDVVGDEGRDTVRLQPATEDVRIPRIAKMDHGDQVQNPRQRG